MPSEANNIITTNTREEMVQVADKRNYKNHKLFASVAVIEAASLGDFDTLKRLVESNATFSQIECYKILISLCESKCEDNGALLKCLNLLLDRGIDPSAKENGGISVLSTAVWNNQINLTVRLIKAGCSINEPDDDGWTPLFFSVQNDNLGMTQLLIDCGAKTNLMDAFGRTPYYIALSSNNKDLITKMFTNQQFEYSLMHMNSPMVKQLSYFSKFNQMLKIGPNPPDRLFGFHDDAIKFLQAIGLDFTACFMKTQNLQLGELLTWKDEYWSEAGVHLSYHKKKISHWVQNYHEEKWGKDATPNLTSAIVEGRLDLFAVLQVLTSLLRVVYINATTTSYAILNRQNYPINYEVEKEFDEISTPIRVAKQQVRRLLDHYQKFKVEEHSMHPDLIAKHDIYPIRRQISFVNIYGVVFGIMLLKYVPTKHYFDKLLSYFLYFYKM